MPQYNFSCNQDHEGCGTLIRLDCSMADLDNQISLLKCPNCKKKKAIRRVYDGESFPMAYQPKTLGTLADKNSSKMSLDYKTHLKDQYETFKKETHWESTKEGIKHKGMEEKKAKNKKKKR